MKKQEKKHSGDAADSESAASPSPAAASAAGSSIATVVGGGKKEDTLFKRVGELFKAGCGSGVLAESTSTSKEEAVHSRICLSLGSGLSILRPHSSGAGKSEGRPASPLSAFSSGAGPASEAANGSDREADEEEGAEDDAEHYYDLLLRPQDLTRLARSYGKLGIVTVPQTVRELTGMGDAQLQAYARELEEAAAEDGRLGSPSSKSSKLARRKKATGTAVSGSNGAAPKKANSLVRLGMEARSFEVAVPRGKWTHIALVATALPQNKLTLYMVSVFPCITDPNAIVLSLINAVYFSSGRTHGQDFERLCVSPAHERARRQRAVLRIIRWRSARCGEPIEHCVLY